MNYSLRGDLYKDAGDFEKALDDFGRAIEVGPKKSWSGSRRYLKRGKFYRELGRLQEALDDFNKANDYYPEYVTPYVERGSLYIELTQFDMAVDDYTRVIEIGGPYKPQAYHYRAIAFAELGQRELSSQDKIEACALDRQYC